MTNTPASVAEIDELISQFEKPKTTDAPKAVDTPKFADVGLFSVENEPAPATAPAPATKENKPASVAEIDSLIEGVKPQEKPLTIGETLHSVGMAGVTPEIKAIADQETDPVRIRQFPAWHEKTEAQQRALFNWGRNRPVSESLGEAVTSTAESIWPLAKAFGTGAYEVSDALFNNQFHPTNESVEDRKKRLEEADLKRTQALKAFGIAVTGTAERLGRSQTKFLQEGHPWLDPLREKMGYISEEEAFQNFKGRDVFDTHFAQYDEKVPDNFARIIDYSRPVTQGAANKIITHLSSGVEQIMAENPSMTREQAVEFKKERDENLSKQFIDRQIQFQNVTKPTENMQTFADFVSPYNEFMLAAKGLQLAKGASKYLSETGKLKTIKAIDELTESFSPLGGAVKQVDEVFDKGMAKKSLSASEQGMIGKWATWVSDQTQKGGKKVEELLDNVPDNLRPYVEKALPLGKLALPLTPVGAGLYLSGDDQDPFGKFEGFLKGAAGAGALIYGPKIVSDLSKGRALAAGGLKDTITATRAMPDVSMATKAATYPFSLKIPFKEESVGRFIADRVRNHIADGVNTLALTTAVGAFNGDDAQRFGENLGMGLLLHFPHAYLNSALGKNPTQMARDAKRQEFENYRFLRQLPESDVQKLQSSLGWDGVVSTAKQNLVEATNDYNKLSESERSSEKGLALAKQVTALKGMHDNLANANEQTRKAYAGEVLSKLANDNLQINGLMPNRNTQFRFMTTQEIVDHLLSVDPVTGMRRNPTIDEDAARAYAAVTGATFESNGQVRLPDGKLVGKAKSGVFFDPLKDSVVINVDRVREKQKATGKSLMWAVTHETEHALSKFEEYNRLTRDLKDQLFGKSYLQEDGSIIRTNGIYDKPKLVEMFINNYLQNRKGYQAKAEFAKQHGLWDFTKNNLNDEAVARYMQDEIMAESRASGLYGRTRLNSARQNLVDWALVNHENNLLAKAIKASAAQGVPFYSNLTGATFTPEQLAQVRQNQIAIEKYNGILSRHDGSDLAPRVTPKDIKNDRVLAEHFAKDDNNIQTMKLAEVVDQNGNVVKTIVVNESSPEGEWVNKTDGSGGITKTKGFGDLPVELQSVDIPEGSKLRITKQLVLDPNGKPIEVDKKIRNAKNERAKQIQRNILLDQSLLDQENPQAGMRPANAEGTNFRGTPTMKQFEAILALPEDVLPYSIKEKLAMAMGLMNDGEGTPTIGMYSQRMDKNGNYVPFSPKIVEGIQIGLQFSKDGHWLFTEFNKTGARDKANLILKYKPEILRNWNFNVDDFMVDLGKYMNNWKFQPDNELPYSERAAQLRHKNLDPDFQKAMEKRYIFDAFLNIKPPKDEIRPKNLNPLKIELPKIPKSKMTKEEKEDDRRSDTNTMVRSRRVDAYSSLEPSAGVKMPMDYQKAKFNAMPDMVSSETPRIAEGSKEEQDLLSQGYTKVYRGGNDGNWWTPDRDAASTFGENVSVGYLPPNLKSQELTGENWNYKIDVKGLPKGVDFVRGIENHADAPFDHYTYYISDDVKRTMPRGGGVAEQVQPQAPAALQKGMGAINATYVPANRNYYFTTATDRIPLIAKLHAEGKEDEIRKLNNTAINHAFSDMKGMDYNVVDTTGVYQGDREAAAIIDVKPKTKLEEDQSRARVMDIAKLFLQKEVLEEKVGAGRKEMLGQVDDDGYTHMHSVQVDVSSISDYDIEKARIAAGIDGLTLAKGKILLLDRGLNGQEFINQSRRLFQALHDAGAIIGGISSRVSAVKTYSENPQEFAGSTHYDDPSISLHSQNGEAGRLKSPLVRKIFEMMGKPLPKPQEGRKSYFDASDLTPEQVKKQVEIQKAFDAIPLNDLATPLVYKAYDALNKEIGKQYDFLTSEQDGVPKFEFYSQPWELEGEPYKSSAASVNDIRTKNKMKFLKTDPSSFGPEGSDFSYHPLLQDSGRVDANGVKLSYNDLFRAVHDAIAHGLYGVEYGPIGEESAWNTHIRTLEDPMARWALTTETRGQNSWVNYRDQFLKNGEPVKKSDPDYIPLNQRGFSDQKAALLPLEYVLTGDKAVDKPVLDLMRELGAEQSKGSLAEKSVSPEQGKSKIQMMPDMVSSGSERIVSATYTDPRTGEVKEGFTHLDANPKAPKEQTDRESRYYGFKTDTGRVVSREEAYRIAEASGQLKTPTSEEDRFNSERGVLHSNMIEMQPTTEISPKIDADYMKAVESNDVEAQQKLVDEKMYNIPEHTTEYRKILNGWEISVYGSDDFKNPKVTGQITSKPDSILINTIEATPESKGKGFGKALYLEIARFAQESGQEKISGSASEEAINVRKSLFPTSVVKNDDLIDALSYISPNIKYIPKSFKPSYDDAGNVIPLSQRFNEKSQNLENGENILKYFKKIHPDKQSSNKEIEKFIINNEWQLKKINPDKLPTENDLYEYDDFFNRVIDINQDSVNEYINQLKETGVVNPIIIGPQNTIIDGNHRAQASKITNIPIEAYVPVAFMPDMVSSGELRPTQDMPQSALKVLYADSDLLPKPEKKIKNAAVALALADVAEKKYGGKIKSETITPEQEADFALNGANEAEAALKASGKNAANWYSTAIKAALAVAATIYKPLSDLNAAKANPYLAKESDPVKAAQFALRIPLAITSQNVSVPENTKYAETQFKHFLETGKFNEELKHGAKAPAISSNLALANRMIDELGSILALEDFVKQEFSVRDLELAASKIVGKKLTIAGLKDDMVNGAAIFGPKIGQGFLQNLMGKFDPVTIDLWMRRTWGRWTGDVVGDGVTGQRLARIINEYKNSKRELPESLKGIKTEMRSLGVKKNGQPTKPELTITEDIESRLEEDPEFRKGVETFAAAADKEFQGYYKLMSAPMTQKSKDALTKAMNVAANEKDPDDAQKIISKAYNKFINDQIIIKNAFDEEFKQLTPAQKKALNAEDPSKAISKENWKAMKHQEAKRVVVLKNEEKNILKPKWANAAKSIVADLNPIDIPSDIDRKVITRVVNKIREHLESRGYNVTNADVQAILWYPEKDLWAKLRGEEESNLKQSYDDEFLKIAEERGVGEEARKVARDIRGY